MMITDLVVGGLLFILRAMISALPEWSLDTDGWASVVGALFGGLGWINGYFPVVTLLTCLALVYGARVALFAYSIGRSLWDALPLT